MAAAHDGLILEVLNRLKNIVLNGKKKKVTSGRTGGGGHVPQCPPPPPSGSGPESLFENTHIFAQIFS